MTVQLSNFTADINGQDNFGKAVLAIASVKAKEMHNIFIFNFGVHPICFYPNAQIRNQKITKSAESAL